MNDEEGPAEKVVSTINYVTSGKPKQKCPWPETDGNAGILVISDDEDEDAEEGVHMDLE
jgi:hypothetical protein